MDESDSSKRISPPQGDKPSYQSHNKRQRVGGKAKQSTKPAHPKSSVNCQICSQNAFKYKCPVCLIQ